MGQQEQMLEEAGPNSADDVKLVADVLSKDRKATAEFVSRYADCVYSYVRRRVMPNSAAADDLIQEIFLAAWKNLGGYRADAPLRHWLLGIARHKVDDYYRKRLYEVDWPEGDDELVQEPMVIPRFEEQLDSISRDQRIHRVLAGLPEAYSLALLWRYVESRSLREMAQLTGKTEKAMERLLARAREHFRRSWIHAA
ncbi:MAG TPA: sigma-70 family RNA polymerase sigma factor [Candidatus Solibacter sp.]|jgi:RNA polymerase sigma-70 factor (ECF subfamily)|nr:sigma-70 family RNA polymerase sigma factor [Candidatus Solibacter sp.]